MSTALITFLKHGIFCYNLHENTEETKVIKEKSSQAKTFVTRIKYFPISHKL